MLKTSSSTGTNMGAIDPKLTRTRAKLKSASIEMQSSEQQQPQSMSNLSIFGSGQQDDRVETVSMGSESCPLSKDGSFQSRAKKFLTLSPGTLKPSASTSCLFAASSDGANQSSTKTSPNNSLVTIPTRASLTHEWKKLKTPNKCRECNVLVYFNGRECSFCGFVAHKKCVTMLVIKCSGSFIKNKRLCNAGQEADGPTKSPFSLDQIGQEFNFHLHQNKTTRPAMQPIYGQPIKSDSHQVVDFIRRFIYEIDTRGLTSKGIYRVSSIKSKVDRLCNYYDQNLSSLVDLSSFHPNIIANALKMYLRRLPEPLLTHELYEKFIDLAKKYASSSSGQTTTTATNRRSQSSSLSKHRKSLSSSSTNILSGSCTSLNNCYDPLMVADIREIIDLLPTINRQLIAIIMRHLRRVADMSHENQMSAKNLSIIFGPTLLSASNKSLAIVDNIHQARLIELMITWADQIFPQYANYESKAVIELNLSEEYLKEQERLLSLSQSQQNSRRPSRNDLGGGGDASSSGSNNDGSGPNDQQQPQSPNTRNDLRELRRKFFTPEQQPQERKYPPPLPLPQQLPKLNPISSTNAPIKPQATATNKQQQPQQPGRLKLNDYPMSVPVIKIQPYYCNTLKK